MTIKELMERLTKVRDSIDTDFMNRYAIEGVMNDINILIDDVNSFGVDDKTDPRDIKPDIDLDVSAEHNWRKTL